MLAATLPPPRAPRPRPIPPPRLASRHQPSLSLVAMALSGAPMPAGALPSVSFSTKLN